MTAEPSVSPGATVEGPPAVPSHPRPRWHERPERLAWIIILNSFVVLLVLLTGIPLALRALYETASVEQSLSFETTVGTVLLYPPRSEQPIAVTERREAIGEGSRLETTGAATQGVLGLPMNGQSDGLMGTILLHPSTSLEILRSRRPYFAGSDQPYRVRLRVLEGQVRLFTRSPMDRAVEVQIETPHGEALLGEGNYAFIVNSDGSEVVVKQGTASLFQLGQDGVEIQSGLRTWMLADGTTLPPVPAAHSLLRGGFGSPLGLEWESYFEPPYTTPGTVEFLERDGRQTARFYRLGENGIHTEVGIRQIVDQDVHSYD